MSRPFWIASYPKAGNTWVRFLMADLLAGPIADAAQVETLIPDTHKAPRDGPALHRGAAFYKTHRLPAAHRLAPGNSAGALYVVRNPLDLFCSCLRYQPGEAADFLFRVATAGGVPAYAERGFGTLLEHVDAWLNAPIPVLAVRYEDLASDPIRVVADIAKRLRVPKTPVQIAATVRRCSFKAMQAMEEAGGEGPFDEPDRPAGLRFMHRGRVGGFRELLSDTEIDMLASSFADVMERLGYALDADRNLVIAGR